MAQEPAATAPAHQEPVFFTQEELAKHDGSDGGAPLLICVQGMIFDVTPARSFYGPGVCPFGSMTLIQPGGLPGTVKQHGKPSYMHKCMTCRKGKEKRY